MNYTSIIYSIGRLYVLVLTGFIVFRQPWLQKNLLPVLLNLLIMVGFPIFSISRIGIGWHEALDMGWLGMVGFFLLGLGMISFQFFLGRLLVKFVPKLQSNHPRELLVLFALHNAGYIPLAFLGVIVTDGVMVYLFYYVMAFNLIFWTFSIPLLEKGSPRFTIRVTPPLIGILLGIFFAWTGLYHGFPQVVRSTMGQIGAVSMDLILVVLGGTLAVIPLSEWRGLTELRWLLAIKLLAYPLLMTGLALAIQPWLLGFLDPLMAGGIGMVIIVQASVPPATNIMVVARKYASQETMHVLGGGMLMGYGASLITLPLFVALGMRLLGLV